MKFLVLSEYTIADQIIVSVERASTCEEVATVIISDDQFAEIVMQSEEILNDLPVVNAMHLMTLTLKALIDATDETTEIPMCVDTSFEI